MAAGELGYGEGLKADVFIGGKARKVRRKPAAPRAEVRPAPMALPAPKVPPAQEVMPSRMPMWVTPHVKEPPATVAAEFVRKSREAEQSFKHRSQRLSSGKSARQLAICDAARSP